MALYSSLVSDIAAIIAELVLVVIFCMNKKMRAFPGGLFLSLSLFGTSIFVTNVILYGTNLSMAENVRCGLMFVNIGSAFLFYITNSGLVFAFVKMIRNPFYESKWFTFAVLATAFGLLAAGTLLGRSFGYSLCCSMSVSAYEREIVPLLAIDLAFLICCFIYCTIVGKQFFRNPNLRNFAFACMLYVFLSIALGTVTSIRMTDLLGGSISKPADSLLRGFQHFGFVLLSLFRLADPAIRKRQLLFKCCKRKNTQKSIRRRFAHKQSGDTIDNTLEQSLMSGESSVYLQVQSMKNNQSVITMNTLLLAILSTIKASHHLNSDPIPSASKHKYQILDHRIAERELGTTCQFPFKVIIKSYLCDAFGGIRRAEGISWQDLLEGLLPEHNQNAISNAHQSYAKSGSFFFFGDDGRFTIKTISSHEIESFLERLGDQYFEHMKAFPRSYLCRIYGIFKVTEPFRQPLYLMVMENQRIHDPEVVTIYDLKGSTLGRKSNHSDQETVSDVPAIMKDVDFLQSDFKIQLSQDSKDKVYEQLLEDVALLRDAGLIDYSLLLVVLETRHMSEMLSTMEEEQSSKTPQREVSSPDGRLKHRIAIIDFLQAYTFKRGLERQFRKLQTGSLSPNSSIQPAHPYADRFVGLLERIFNDDVIEYSYLTAEME